MRKKLAYLQRSILSDKNTRNLFFFLLLNLFFAFVELFYGLWTNSALLLGLAASIIAKKGSNDKFTYGYGRAETLAGLANGLFLLFIAMFIMKEAIERTFEPPEVHHERLFVISVLGFIVNLIGIFVFQHGGQGHHHNHIFGGSCPSHSHGHDHAHHHHHADELHGLYSAPTISSKPPVTQTVGGLVALDMNGYSGPPLTINPSSAIHPHSHDHKHNDYNSNNHTQHHHDHSHDHHNHHHHHHHHEGPPDSAPLIHENYSPSMPTSRSTKSKGRGQIMQSVFLHIVADTLGSVGVMISAILMNQFGWMIADPLCSLFIAILISISVYPLLRDVVNILMQRVPVELEDKLPDCLHRIRSLPGVRTLHDVHFWTLSSDTYIGCLKLDVAKEADHAYIQASTKSILGEIGIDRLNVELDLI